MAKYNVPDWAVNSVVEASKKTGVDPDLLLAFSGAESAFKVDAVSPTNVKGWFQITEGTWKTIRGKEVDPKNPAKKRFVPYSVDVNEQALTAAMLISGLMHKYNNDITKVGIAYNAGEDVVDKAIAWGGGDITSESLKRAVQYHISKGTKGFGPGKVKEVFGYAPKINRNYAKYAGVSGYKPTSIFPSVDELSASKTPRLGLDASIFDITPPSSVKMASAATRAITGEKYDDSADPKPLFGDMPMSSGKTIDFDPEKPFLQNMMANSLGEVNGVKTDIASLDLTKSKFIKDIKSGIAKLNAAKPKGTGNA